MKKILELYGTLGPADCSQDTLDKMFQAGMTGLRLNLSHTSLPDCEEWLSNLYAVSERRHIVPDLLVDLQGPEVRIGILQEPLSLMTGNTVHLCSLSSLPLDVHGTSLPVIPVPEPALSCLKEEHVLRLDDGKIFLKVRKITDIGVLAEVVVGGTLFSRKSLAIDGVSIELPTLTRQDLENLKLLKKYRVTGVMLPFVRGADDLMHLKKALLTLGLGHIRIFAKIENRRGVEHLTALLPHCDQIVIARGDLGNAYPLPKLPAIQKEIARTCLAFRKPFMIVTQMLASMTKSPIATRAEVSDIFNAVLDGASSLMLTGETAAGNYPVEAMQVLADTAFEAQRYHLEAKFML